MAISYFDSANYLTQKLAQLQEVDPAGELNGGKPWTTTDEVNTVLAAQGFTPESHFEAYGKYEDLSPVKEFNADEYYALKAAQLNAMNNGAGFEPNGNAWTAAQAEQAIKDAGLSAWDHYVQYGSKEGVSPSNSLDEGKYLQAKAEALNAAKYEGRNDWTSEQVKAAIEQGGMTVLDHYEQYAGKGDLEAAAIPATGPNPYEVSDQPTPGDTLTLTTGKDVLSPTAEDPAFRTTADADVINGEVKTPSTSTLNAVDQIDGGAGMDTLNVAMHNNFTGFTDGFMKNVEVVNLTNAGSKAYSFSTKNMEGVETYNLKGAVNLKDVASTDAAVNVADLASGAMSVAYAADAVKGTEDALKLGLSNVGTAGEGNAEKSVSVTAAGIENLNVTASGSNIVDLSGVKDATALNVAGDGSLKVTKVAAGVKDVDASTATGALNLNLSAATNVESVKLGSGDDTVIVKNIKVDAALDGGAGNDEVVLDMNGVTGAVVKQPQMTGVETLTFKDAAVKTTFSGTTATGLETVKVQNLGAAGEIVLAEMGNASLNVAFDGASAGTVTVADDLALTINAAGDTAATVSTGITAAKASSVSLNVDGKMSYTGTLTAAAATEVNIAVNGEGVMGGNIVADNATDVTLAATSSKGVTFGEDSSFKAVQNLNLSALADVSINGVGGESQAVTVDGAGVKGNLTLTVADTNVDAADVAVTGSNLGVNTIIVKTGYDTIAVTGGIQDDTVTLAENFAAATGSEVKSLTVDLGTVSSGDQLILGASTAGTIDFTGWDVTLNGVDFINAASAGATLKMDADALSGQKVTIGATASASFAAADFSGTDGNDTIDFSNITGTISSLYIKGGDGDDVITIGSAGTVDYIMGGDGADKIYLAGGASGATAHIQYEATNATDMNLEGNDAIYGFVAGSSNGDVIEFAKGLLIDKDGDAISVTSVSSTNGALDLSGVESGSTGIYAFTYDMENIDATAIAAKLNESGHVVTVASNEQFVFAFDDGSDTYLYLFADADGAGTGSKTVDADELHLIGVLEGVSDAGSLLDKNFSLIG